MTTDAYQGGQRGSGRGQDRGRSNFRGDQRGGSRGFDGGRGRGGRGGQGGRRREPIRPKFGSDRELLSLLRGLDGNSYGSYKRAIGEWNYGSFKVLIDRIQSDPYAPPSAVRIVSDPQTMGLDPLTYTTSDQQIATGDFLIRNFLATIKSDRRFHNISIANVTQALLERSAAVVTPTRVELRIQVQMPARGRTVQGFEAATIFDLALPDAVNETFDFATPQAAEYRLKLEEHVHTLEDHRALQKALVDNDWLAFVADDSILPRRSGVSQLPMDDAVPFKSPESLRRTVTLPHAGEVTGMIVEPGITVIVGGGYNGKSTLLHALQRGVYPHVPGDGRELVATLPDAMKIRAADGRPVTKVDVSPFINHLPTEANTHQFSTQNASGSTSQAASMIEAIQMGTPFLLIDEDTSATNLMIRDERMRELVVAAQEPITPLIDRIQGLSDKGKGTSLMLVMGGSGAFLDVADRVLQMDDYNCLDVTDRAEEVVKEIPREYTDIPGFPELNSRSPFRLRGGGGGGKPKTKAMGLDAIQLDKQNINVSDVEQIVDPGQTEAIAWAVRGVLEDWANAEKTLPELMAELDAAFTEEAFDVLVKFGARKHPAFMVRPRMIDVAAAINRDRALQIV